MTHFYVPLTRLLRHCSFLFSITVNFVVYGCASIEWITNNKSNILNYFISLQIMSTMGQLSYSSTFTA